VQRRDHRATDAEALEAAGLEHAAGAELVLGVLEHAPERAPVRRLCRLAARVELGDRGSDLVGRTGAEPKPDAGDDRGGVETGATVGQAELAAVEPARAARVDYERALDDLPPVASVGTGVHLHSPADRPRNRARELEPAEPGVTGPVESDRVRRRAACDENTVTSVDRGELPVELDHEPVDALVRDQQVRPEPDDGDVEVPAGRPLERPFQLAEGRRPR